MVQGQGFGLEPGERVNGRYEIVDLLGGGVEGEVYLVKERETGIERAAKFFYPDRNRHGRESRRNARKLHKLRDCGLLIHYHTQDEAFLDGELVTFLVSEYIDGERLSEYVARQPGKRLHPFAALHVLHSLAVGLEEVHRHGEYHGDIHDDNILVQRVGLRFELKLVDLFNRGCATAEQRRADVLDLVRLLYDIVGGAAHYAKMPLPIKEVCCGLKQSLIFEKFRTAGQLKAFLETLEWD
jgi:tRNA A-37 threonylcarbamoyl transferase component Bud32